MDCQYFHLSFLFHDSFYDLFYATNMTRGNKNAFDVIARFMGCRRLKFFFVVALLSEMGDATYPTQRVVRHRVSWPISDEKVDA